MEHNNMQHVGHTLHKEGGHKEEKHHSHGHHSHHEHMMEDF